MVRNYLKTAWRSIIRHKGYSLINIAGLAVGIACCLLITIWILNELGYDRFHTDADRIFQIYAQEGNESTPNILGPALAESFPDIEYATRLDWVDEFLISGPGDTAYEYVMAADPSFFSIFSFPFARGNPARALDDPNSIVITEEVAKRFFPDEDAFGKTLMLNKSQGFTVSGVIKDIPHNSSINFDIMVPFENKIQYHRARGEDYASFGWWSAQTFVKVRGGCTKDILDNAIRDFLRQRWDPKSRNLWAVSLTDLHFHESDAKKYVYFFAAIAFVILAMACTNFVNLSIARSAKRAREAGIRKVAGAQRRHLMAQFLGESVLLTLCALILSFGLLDMFLSLAGSTVGLERSLKVLFSGRALPLVILLPAIIGFAAGIYPALYFSAFQPLTVLKSSFRLGTNRSLLRKALVLFQFAASIFLIIGTIVIYRQLEYFKTKDVGYNRERVVTIGLNSDTRKYYTDLKNEFLRSPRVQMVSGGAAGLPFWRWTTDNITWPGKNPDQKVEVALNMVDYDFTQTVGIRLAEGRDFSRDFPSDSIAGYVINEEMVRLMGLTSGLGADLTIHGKPGKVIGVMRNFHFRSLATRIQPLAFLLRPEVVSRISIKIDPGDISSALAVIKQAWEKCAPGYPFDYAFLDQQYNAAYGSVRRMANLAGSFALLAIFIACLGLYGLASFAAEQRTKEIGIRKVLGASTVGIMRLVTREFLALVLTANIVAWPLAYYIMNRWLQSFAYRIHLDIGVFLLSGLLAAALALATVGYHAVRAARANPVDSLKYE